jgi:hypothetical protein
MKLDWRPIEQFPEFKTLLHEAVLRGWTLDLLAADLHCPAMLAVIVATFAGRFKRDWRRCCDAKKRNCANREDSHAPHCNHSYQFVVAVWRAKAAESAA